MSVGITVTNVFTPFSCSRNNFWKSQGTDNYALGWVEKQIKLVLDGNEYYLVLRISCIYFQQMLYILN